MSVIHLNQIKAALKNKYEGKIDLTDQKKEAENYEDFFFTRALAAYAIQFNAGIESDIFLVKNSQSENNFGTSFRSVFSNAVII